MITRGTCTRFNPDNLTPWTAIRLYCRECSAGNAQDCDPGYGEECVIWPYRRIKPKGKRGRSAAELAKIRPRTRSRIAD